MKNYSIPQKYKIKKTTANMSLFSSYKHNKKGMEIQHTSHKKKTEKKAEIYAFKSQILI